MSGTSEPLPEARRATPAGHLDFIGIVEAPGRALRLAVFSVNGRVAYGRVGELIAEQYRVRGFSEEEAEVVDTATDAVLKIAPPPSAPPPPAPPASPPSPAPAASPAPRSSPARPSSPAEPATPSPLALLPPFPPVSPPSPPSAMARSDPPASRPELQSNQSTPQSQLQQSQPQSQQPQPLPEVTSGTLRLMGESGLASIFIDGIYAGTIADLEEIPGGLSLEPGVHHLELRPQDFQPVEVDVRIDPHRITTYRLELPRRRP